MQKDIEYDVIEPGYCKTLLGTGGNLSVKDMDSCAVVIAGTVQYSKYAMNENDSEGEINNEKEILENFISLYHAKASDKQDSVALKEGGDFNYCLEVARAELIKELFSNVYDTVATKGELLNINVTQATLLIKDQEDQHAHPGTPSHSNEMKSTAFKKNFENNEQLSIEIPKCLGAKIMVNFSHLEVDTTYVLQAQEGNHLMLMVNLDEALKLALTLAQHSPTSVGKTSPPTTPAPTSYTPPSPPRKSKSAVAAFFHHPGAENICRQLSFAPSEQEDNDYTHNQNNNNSQTF